MADFKLTEEQENCIGMYQESEKNLLLSALAGAAKTTTLRLMTETGVPDNSLAVAFNKRIAEELAENLPHSMTVKTMNSLGHRAWQRKLGGKRLRVNGSKLFGMLKEYIKAATPEQEKYLQENFSETLRDLNLLRAYGYVPPAWRDKAREIYNNPNQPFDYLEERHNDWIKDILDEIISDSIREAFNGYIDFTDQIYMSAVFKGVFDRWNYVFIDEAQDLSGLDHIILKRLVRGRLIAVGDRHQAIYGFRGASSTSMDLLRDEFDMEELTLNTSFRCSRAVVHEAQVIVPHMEPASFASEGAVDQKVSWGLEDIDEEAAVICRNNAPLFRLAITLLKNGRAAELVGIDMTASFNKILKECGSDSLSSSDALVELKKWYDFRVQTTNARRTLDDKYECLKLFLENTPNIKSARALVETVTGKKARLKLMTGHKSKGLEFERTYFLDEHLCGDKGQDPNVRYVIITRAKDHMTYITSKGCYDYEENVQ